VKLRGKTHKGNFIKIKTKNGKIGWVHTATVRLSKPTKDPFIGKWSQEHFTMEISKINATQYNVVLTDYFVDGTDKTEQYSVVATRKGNKLVYNENEITLRGDGDDCINHGVSVMCKM
jgi:hypothetical protein